MSASPNTIGLVTGIDDLGCALGIDIGGTKLAVGLAGPDGLLAAASKVQTPQPATGGAVMGAVDRLVARKLATGGAISRRVVAIGVGTAGVIDPASGTIISSTDSLLDWRGVQLRRNLEDRFGLPVSVDNDVNALATAEARIGAGRAFTRLLVVAVGTGIGGAFVRDGQVDRGATGTCGEIGHLPVAVEGGPLCGCGRSGHLEAYASGPAMARGYGQLSGSGSTVDYREVDRRARRGDPIARRVVADAGGILGRAIGGLVNAFDPEAVILGGGVASSGSPFLSAVHAAYRAELLPGPSRTRLRSARFRTFGGVIGAAILALDRYARISPQEAPRQKGVSA